ncbi:MAG: nicotinate (nicotinamide) nucleotide adenylyltransferase [Solirubrobacteraceae bacterium]
MPAIGILGGTFNPPHLGHLALARHARAELGLDRVLLMPLHTPPHKTAGVDPGPEHRLAMCRLAVSGDPGLEACALEIERGGPSYTADTLSEIHARHPEAELTFIVGADTAGTLPGWREPGRILELARLAVAGRPGTDRGQVLKALGEVAPGSGEQPGAQPRVAFLTMAPIEVSSSLARDRLAAGEQVEDLVGGPVSGYIAEHRLYRSGERAPA